MGRDLYISCKDCEESYWYGQKYRIYNPDKLIDFMDKHQGHNMTSSNDCDVSHELVQGFSDYESS